jgi:hypothetical protein
MRAVEAARMAADPGGAAEAAIITGGAAEAAMSTASGLAADDSIGPAIPAAEAAAEAVRLIECCNAAQTAVSGAIAQAMAIIEATEDVYDIGQFIAYAKEQVDCIDGSPEISASALNAITQAVASCPAGGLGDALYVAQKLSRDYLVWRTQLRTPLDNRTMFVELVRAAAGAGNMDLAQFSQVMHAHAKEVGTRFQRAFSSNSKRERNRARPARTKPKNKNKLGGASGGEVQGVVVEVEEFGAGAAEAAAFLHESPGEDNYDQPRRGLAAAWLDAGLQEMMSSLVWL